MSERGQEARKAFEKRDLEASKRAHAEKKIEEDTVHRRSAGRYIGDLVFGALDGIITTFAVVAGVAGASLSSSIVLILGFANLFADGSSMALGNYLSTKSEQEYGQRERKREEWEIDQIPEGEREEIRQIYRKKGFQGKDLERVTEIITSSKRTWVDTMMMEELNIMLEEKSPRMSGLATFAAFVTVGFVPLLAYVAALLSPALKPMTFLIAVVMTLVAIFIVGSARSYVTGKPWWRAGIEMTSVGGAAALVAYLVGRVLGGLAG
ncbi:VIT1/CCC1 transporter family protein [[Eubacterium] cellulosolvens]